ncbi:hypothetical protein AWC38_SpisGene19707 [Stylophora pistillata]|uniref:Uncharacterized protein n=1 Tax=Stylophora pistillata TaxID=50429 RepID=A0A2B4RGU8_STYPI|nr:hypothetical protein AWC38_SpisGene19707 [Stylophora pistillata]
MTDTSKPWRNFTPGYWEQGPDGRVRNVSSAAPKTKGYWKRGHAYPGQAVFVPFEHVRATLRDRINHSVRVWLSKKLTASRSEDITDRVDGQGETLDPYEVYDKAVNFGEPDPSQRLFRYSTFLRCTAFTPGTVAKGSYEQIEWHIGHVQTVQAPMIRALDIL